MLCYGLSYMMKMLIKYQSDCLPMLEIEQLKSRLRLSSRELKKKSKMDDRRQETKDIWLKHLYTPIQYQPNQIQFMTSSSS
jgi:hypothetical protein